MKKKQEKRDKIKKKYGYNKTSTALLLLYI